MAVPETPTYFATPAEFRTWLEEHHATAEALWVGFHKKGSGTPSVTWPESVDEALCFGWIDGVRKNVDALRYKIRFTPRRDTSRWSTINVEKVAALEKEGRMRPAGRRAFAARTAEKSGTYSYEQRRDAVFDAGSERRFRAETAAWELYQSQPPGYRNLATFWVMGAKKEETRERRLEKLIEWMRSGRPLRELVTLPKKK